MRETRAAGGKNKKQGRRKVSPILVIVALAVFAFAMLALVGLFGSPLRDFFAGVFGFTGYAFFALALLFTVLKGFGILRRKAKSRTLLYAAGLVFILLLYIQVMTSFAEYEEIGASVTYGSYLNACYEAGFGTSGGVLLGWIAYPLLSLIGKYAAIPLAVLFFVVLFFALLPVMRGSVQAGAPARKERASHPAKSAKKKSEPVPSLRLFVDKVQPGQKDAQKIKTVGFFGKKSPEPEFFDYRDNRPLYAPDGVIPEEKPERYDAYAADRSAVSEDAYDDYFDQAPVESSRSRVYPDVYRREDSSDGEDMPAFMRRYAEERRNAAPSKEPEPDANIPDLSTPEPKAALAPQTTVRPAPIPHTRPRARVDDIISDMSDLHRIRERENAAPKRDAFLGETPSSIATPEEPSVLEREQAASAFEPERKISSPMTSEPLRREEPKTPEREASSDVPFGAASTITPREASAMRPKEERPVSSFFAAAPSPSPSRSEPTRQEASSSEEEPEALIRQRKPRSDIGGTHRTQQEPDRQPGGYIPPKKVEQLDMMQAMKEEEEAPARPYTPPPVTLLQDIPSVQDEDGVEERAEMLVQALSSFNITSEVVDHKTGPTFTQFAVTLPDNMSVNKLTPLEKDIKRKLKVEKNIRIIPSVPGLDAVGIEVPNKKTSMVGLRSIINSPDFAKEGKLFFAIGVDVSGRAVYGDLLKMPHLLVAGSTGSGKSVCLNVMICSMMYHYSPEVVRFIMVDPKKVELSVYKNMPHMLMPSTVTEPDKAINALTWAVNEMERRYQLLMENGCRNIGEYNALQAKTGGKRLYYIVFIIDEMADLMYTAKRDVEEKVNRIAAKARAAGIHLVVATQRPSVDVITGTIKNNIPTRIAFKVTSFTDSKTILDRAGAESLFGNGDMLYMPPEGGDPIRLQGPYINDEISEIVRFIKDHNDCRFDSAAEKTIQADKEEQTEPAGGGDQPTGDEEDPLFAPSLLYFIDIGQASISKLQIKYHMGYGRAARIVETMSERGYLGPAEGGNKARQVKITREEYYELYGEDGIDGDEIL